MDGGGTLYIFDGDVLTGAAQGSPEIIDLGGAVRTFCLEQTGAERVQAVNIKPSSGCSLEVLNANFFQLIRTGIENRDKIDRRRYITGR